MTPRDPYTPWKLWAGLALVLIVLPIACQRAQAQLPVPPMDCNTYATFAGRVAVLRSVEAKLPLVIQQIRTGAPSMHRSHVDAFVREAQLVYAERQAPNEAAYRAHRRCHAVLGDFGKES